MERATLRLQQIGGHLLESNPTAATGKCPYAHSASIGKCPCKSKCPAFTGSSSRAWSRILEHSSQGPVRVCVTGAAGNIAYSLIFMIASGQMFGSNVPVILHLVDIPPMESVLKGVEMEIFDCAFPLVKGVVATSDLKVGFDKVDAVVFCGAFPRKQGMERKDLLSKNAEIFKVQGKALSQYAAKHVKCVVVGNPANTNCLILMNNAPGIPKENFTALTRLDHNRAQAQLSVKLGVPVEEISNHAIWGNHSATQYPDVSYAVVNKFSSEKLGANIRAAVNDDKWLNSDFITAVQQRGAEVIKARKSSSAASAAFAIVCHMRDWLLGTPVGQVVSMGVHSDGSYGIPQGLIFSYPVVCVGGEWKIVQGLKVSDFSRSKLDITAKELQDERNDASAFLN